MRTLRPGLRKALIMVNILGIFIGALLAVYLLASILKPEKF